MKVYFAVAGMILTVLTPADAMAQACGGPNPQGTTCGPFLGYAAADPSYGSANSMPMQVATVGLDLSDIQVEGPAIQTPDGDSDTIGLAATLGKAGLQKLERYDMHYQHARRIGRGTRMRFLLDVPISVLHADQFTLTTTYLGQTYDLGSFGGAGAVWGTLSAGLELPVSRSFTLTPRVNYTNLQADTYFGRGGERLGPSLSARYRLPQVGRGDLVLGAMVGYTHSLKTFLSTQPFYASEDFWTWRGGLAYQLPLKSRVFGRQSSLRASYVFTYMTGQPYMPYKKVHEVAINLGVRTREAETKGRFDQWRIGLIFTHTDNVFTREAGYNAGTLTLGSRF